MRQARRVHRAVPGRDPVRLRRLRRRRPQPAGLPALPGRQAAARRLQARHQPGHGQARGHPERPVGRGGPRGVTARSSTSPGTSRTAPSPARTTESRHDDEHVRGRPGQRGAEGVHPPAPEGGPRRCGTWSSSSRAPGRSPDARHLPAHRRAVREGPDQEAPRRPRRAPGARGAKRWQPQIRAKAGKKAATTGGIVIDTRARFGYTAAARVDGPGPHPAPDLALPPRLRRPPLRRPGRPAPPSSSSRRSRPKHSRRCTSRTAAAARTAWWWGSPTSSTSTSTSERGGAPSARSAVLSQSAMVVT